MSGDSELGLTMTITHPSLMHADHAEMTQASVGLVHRGTWDCRVRGTNNVWHVASSQLVDGDLSSITNSLANIYGRFVPGLAEAWDFDDGGTDWRIETSYKR